ncbi:uncharacterized protein V1510DRAFT_183546 [Dipodascopsis tothii]|uniref:uncharacterized protein n=1 Tax=Dipodascopsis tothii TaxID=44089 RepID=UPI0034CF9D69
MTSYQTKAAPTHYNDLPRMASGSRRGTSSGGSSPAGGDLIAPGPDEFTDGSGTIGDEATIEQLLEATLAAKTTLPEREHMHYATRLRKVVGSLPAGQASEVRRILRLATDGNKSSAKEAVIKFMMAEQGVATWCAGLRRIVDGLDDRPESRGSWVEVSAP